MKSCFNLRGGKKAERMRCVSYHPRAAAAAALETSTLPTRLSTGRALVRKEEAECARSKENMRAAKVALNVVFR